ncbi:hypothetical protein [Pseudodesulfovibrio tunisiensis]|uniref:hypothetical protein n=1 Tax=Pseudodesulfovibrio tunisiensis TaxID=463192 RepID=UPI001FB1B00F|nr:hypothetical protein [Pseudodesulfovibrio tunisiensis]
MDKQKDPLAPYRLTPDRIRDLLAEQHDVLLGKDDPILMYVTLHNAFLDQYDGVLDRHGQELATFLKKLARQYSNELKGHRQAILGKAVRVSSEHTIQEIAAHKSGMDTLLGEMKRHERHLRLYTFACAVLTLCSGILVTTLIVGAQ